MESINANSQDMDDGLEEMWVEARDGIIGINPSTENWKIQTLPLARIKKIMKSEEFILQELEKDKQQKAAEEGNESPDKPNVKFMISGEAPVLMSKACELLIKDLSFRAWRHTERNRRRTLQRQDLHAAVGESEVYDFLIDIVPRVTTPKQSVPNPSSVAAEAAAMSTMQPPHMATMGLPQPPPGTIPPGAASAHAAHVHPPQPTAMPQHPPMPTVPPTATVVDASGHQQQTVLHHYAAAPPQPGQPAQPTMVTYTTTTDQTHAPQYYMTSVPQPLPPPQAAAHASVPVPASAAPVHPSVAAPPGQIDQGGATQQQHQQQLQMHTTAPPAGGTQVPPAPLQQPQPPPQQPQPAATQWALAPPPQVPNPGSTAQTGQ